MAPRSLEMGLVVALVTALWAGVSAQMGCTTAIFGMAPCLNYITGNSSTPSSSCCSQLASVVSNRPQCLCTVLNGGGSSFGINLNQTQALALPGACNVQTPPASRCKAVSPAAAPTATPVSPTTPSKPTASSPAAPSTPSVSSTPPSISTSGSGSKTVPSSGGASSDASSTSKHLNSLSLVLSAVLFVASYASSALVGF